MPLIVQNITYLNSTYFIVEYSPKKTNNENRAGSAKLDSDISEQLLYNYTERSSDNGLESEASAEFTVSAK